MCKTNPKNFEKIQIWEIKMCFLLLLFVLETQRIATGQDDKSVRSECSCPTYCYEFDTFWTC